MRKELNLINDIHTLTRIFWQLVIRLLTKDEPISGDIESLCRDNTTLVYPGVITLKLL